MTGFAPELRLIINGRDTCAPCAHRTHLGDFIRDTHRLTGTHLGCEHGVCGACTVLLDGKPVRSCITFAVSCRDAHITTIEGYDDDPLMRRLRVAFTEHHALQCGFCTPGMLATARDIVIRLPHADERLVRKELSGNLCRCTGYVGIVRAILSVLADLAAERGAGAAVAASQLPSNTAAREAFRTFQAQPTATPSASNDERTDERELKSDRQGWTRIDGQFDVPRPAIEVWNFMSDLAAVASCLPGATLTETRDNKVKGHIAIKFGPIAAKLNGGARIERNEAAKSGTLHGAGLDTLSNSKASGQIDYRLLELAPNATRVLVDLQFSLQGPLAQFSRSGLVRDFARRMIQELGGNIRQKLDPSAHQQPRTQPASFNPIAIIVSLLWQRLRALFGRRN